MIIDADAHFAPPVEIFKNVFSDTEYQDYQKNNGSYVQGISKYKDSLVNDIKVDRQLLNFYGPSLGMSYATNFEQAQKIANSYNGYLEMLCRDNTEFDYTAWLPFQDIDYCNSIIDDACVQNAFAAHLGEQIPWGFIPEYRNLFSRIAKNKIPVYLHFAGHWDFPRQWKSNIDSRYQKIHDKYPVRPFTGEGQSVSVAWKTTLASFILSGILEDFDLKIIVAEQGIDWIPEFRETMMQLFHVDPLPYFQKFFWFTTEPEEPNFLPRAHELGFDRLLFATDWPHDDPGGANMLSDVDCVKSMLADNDITQNQYDMMTFLNYSNLKNRR
jgi:predicted TIM-barrel fold metal-dependent hydrolase